MYENMYKDYSNQCFRYHYPISFDCRNKAYLYITSPLKAIWCYGDQVPITFTLWDRDPEDEEDIPEYLENKTITINFYNFRRELIHQVEFVPNDVQMDEEKYYIEYILDSETSKLIFTSGVYYCGMTLTDQQDQVETLLFYDRCMIEVK